MRNGDRNKGELGRGDQAMESLGTGARGERTGAREERLEAKKRGGYWKGKRSIFIKNLHNKGKKRFFITKNVKNVTF